jgi:hypothetical protein
MNKRRREAAVLNENWRRQLAAVLRAHGAVVSFVPTPAPWRLQGGRLFVTSNQLRAAASGAARPGRRRSLPPSGSRAAA